MKVIVSNIVKQHTHLLCQSLLDSNRLYKAITTIGYEKKSVILNKDFKIVKKIKNIKNKRVFNIPEHYLITIKLVEILKQLLRVSGIQFDLCKTLLFEKYYDNLVVKKLKSFDFDVFIGSEKCSLKSFKYCKQKGIVTILDLAAVHYNKNEILYDNYAEYKAIINDKKCFDKVNAHKAKELDYVDFIFCLSKYAKQTLIDSGIDEKRIFVHYLPINQKVFFPKKMVSDVSKTLKILFVGRVSRLKGIELILNIAKFFNSKNINTFEFTIVGPKDDSFDISLLAENNIKYKPFLPHLELAKEYQENDVFLSPSYTDSWSQTVIESMSCGTPVIVTENVGAKDAVVKGGGYVVPVNDSDAIIEKLLFLNSNRDALMQLGVQASKIAKDYTFRNYSNKINAVLDTIMHNQRAPL